MTKKRKVSFKVWRKQSLPLHIMLIPATVITLIFAYVPMAGIVVAFQNFKPARGLFGNQEWVGLDNIKFMLTLPETMSALKNTLFISFFKIILGLIVPVIVALLLNEIKISSFKRTAQTIIYFPYFISWVVLSGIIMDVLSPSTGVVNQVITALGMDPVYFLANKQAFPWVLIISDVWKNYGFSMILYLAAISNINQDLYESAIVDGAGIFKRMWYITIPGIAPMIVLMLVLSVGSLLNAGFEQIFTLLNDSVRSSGEIIDTLVYRMGIGSSMYSLSTAVGLFKSVVSLILISTSYYAAYKVADYKVF